jgi:SAM-dependent methyltransferase
MPHSWLGSRLFRRRSRLTVPARFNRNSAKVTALMPPEESGHLLLERMRRRIGFDSYESVRLLDFGCGVRFSQAILNKNLPIGAYTGVDNYEEMIEFLRRSVRDRRFSYVFLDAYHPLYNPSGAKLDANTTLPFEEESYDLISLFSVITHQAPEDSEMIFRLLRRYIKPGGHLFFTCFLDDSIESFEDRSADRNCGFCFYQPSLLEHLFTRAGWTEVDRAEGEGPLIGNSFLLRPSR